MKNSQLAVHCETMYKLSDACVNQAVIAYQHYLASDKCARDGTSCTDMCHEPNLDLYQMEFLKQALAHTLSGFLCVLEQGLLAQGIDLLSEEKLKAYADTLQFHD